MIKILIMDVDGTLTDGGIYVGNTGEIMKKFDVKDGYAIRNFLPQMKITPIVITGRESEIVTRRCQELGIRHVIQGSTNKLAILQTFVKKEQIDMEEIAYIGDDLNDYDCMAAVGVAGCPNNAVNEIKELADYVTEHKGGEGAVREFIEWIKTTKLTEINTERLSS